MQKNTRIIYRVLLIEDDKMDQKKTDFISSVSHELKCFAENKNILLVKTISGSIAPLCSHKSRNRSLISKLLNNAIKFTPAGGTVSINLEHNNSLLEMRVRDVCQDNVNICEMT